MTVQIDQYTMSDPGLRKIYMPALTEWVHVLVLAGSGRGGVGIPGQGGGGGGGGGGLVERNWSVGRSNAYFIVLCGGEGQGSLVRLFDLPFIRTAVAYAGQPGNPGVVAGGAGGGAPGGSYGDPSNIIDNLVFRSQGQSSGGYGSAGNIVRGGGGGCEAATDTSRFANGGSAQGYTGGVNPFTGTRAGNGALVTNAYYVRTAATPTIEQQKFGGGGGGSIDDITPGFGALGFVGIYFYRP